MTKKCGARTAHDHRTGNSEKRRKQMTMVHMLSTGYFGVTFELKRKGTSPVLCPNFTLTLDIAFFLKVYGISEPPTPLVANIH